MFRVYYHWLNRYGTTHKDYESRDIAKNAIHKKFKDNKCAMAVIEDPDGIQKSEIFTNDI